MKAKTKALIMLALAVIMFVIGGCTVAKISGRGPVPLLLNQPTGKVEVIKAVKMSKTIIFDYTAAYDVSEILFNYFGETGADAIINIVFTVKVTPLDYLINLFTLGLANARTIEITGQAVRIRGGSGALYIPEGETLAESENVNGIVPVLMQSAINGSPAMIVRVQGKDGETLYKLVRSNLNTNDR